MSKSPTELLRHILDEIKFLEEERARIKEDNFMHDPLRQRAFARSLEIIGEAIKQIPDDIRKRYPQINWKALAGLRDRLIHHYFGVDYALVWDVVANELPEIKKQLEQIISM